MSRETSFCRDKSTSLLLSRQTRIKVFFFLFLFFCRGSILLSRQTRLLTNVLSRQKHCRGKHTFVATKMILVAAPASHTSQSVSRANRSRTRTVNNRTFAITRSLPASAALPFLPSRTRHRIPGQSYGRQVVMLGAVSYTHLRAHETA